MKMYTRSSARQAQKQINLNSTNQGFSERTSRQIREPVPLIFISDDSDDDTQNLRGKSYNRKSGRRVIKCRTKTYSDESDSESKTRPVPSSSKEEHLFQDKLLHSKTRKRVTKPSIVFSEDSDDERRSLNNPTLKLSTPRKQKLQTSDRDLDQDTYASPPKQKKLTEGDVPRTPKHNKTERSEEVQTPSHLLLKLQLTSPTHTRLIEQGKGSNRKELFKDKETSSVTKNEKFYTGKIIKKNSSFYRNARKALHTSYPTDMPGREKELNELREFIRTRIENKTSGSLYISGPPGTGKTATLNIILQEDNISSKLHKVYINCTAIKSATAIYSRIAKELGLTVKTEKDSLVAVENYLKNESKMILLVLDEIDQLESKNQSILYTIFEWPSKPNSQLILVGIANALDLTDRKLCRLQGHYKLKPKLMHFAPYTKQQILQIFTSRLKSAGVLEVFSPAALQILAGKFAAGSGDIRRALDIGRRAVELIDQTNEEVVLKPVENLVNGHANKEEKETETKLKSVEVKQVVNVLNDVYGTSQNLVDDTDNTFPLQQKIIICSLILMLKKARNKDITVGKLHEVYKRVCTKRNILNVDQAEFVGLCSLIETRGIIRVTGRKEPRLNKVNLEWDEEEVASALKDKQLMSTILQDESCLGKL